jgi:hypothetical protein
VAACRAIVELFAAVTPVAPGPLAWSPFGAGEEHEATVSAASRPHPIRIVVRIGHLPKGKRAADTTV